MTDKYDTASKKLLDLDNRITHEINIASNELKILYEIKDKSQTNINFHRLNHIHDLFDEASEVIKQLTLDSTSENLVGILEAKRHIQENFGSYQFVRREINKITNSLEKDDMALERTPEEIPIIINPDELTPESDNLTITEDDNLNEEYEFYHEEAQDSEREKKLKKEKNSKERKRQEKLRQEREIRENNYRNDAVNQNMSSFGPEIHSQYNDAYRFIKDFDDNDRYSEQQRQEEAYRIGMRVSDDRHITDTDLQREKYRQYEEELTSKDKEEALRRQEQEVFDRYRLREEDISNYESFGKEHIDFSSEYQKERNQQRYTDDYDHINAENERFKTSDSQERKPRYYVGASQYSNFDDSYSETRTSVNDNYNNYKIYSYAPPENNSNDYSVYETAYGRFNAYNNYENIGVANNRDIYKSIDNQIKAARETGTTATISAVYTDMIKRNVDTAYDYLQNAKGTPDESFAVQQYKEQRRYLDDIKRDIRNNVYKVEGEKYTPIKHISFDEAKDQPNHSTQFTSYVPGGTVSESSSVSNTTTGQYRHYDRDNRDNLLYTPENPMVVSKEYRDAIYKRAMESRETFNKLVEYGQINNSGPLKISEKTSAEMALAMDAYKGFKSAQKAGIVVVSEDAVLKNPDFEIWQQRRDYKYDSLINSRINRPLDNKNQYAAEGIKTFKYTVDNPLIVSEEFRDKIYSRGIAGQKYLSNIELGIHDFKLRENPLFTNAKADSELNVSSHRRTNYNVVPTKITDYKSHLKEFESDADRFKSKSSIQFVISNDYRNTLFKNAKESKQSISEIVSHRRAKTLDAKIAVDEYKNFKKAEKDGVIRVSNNSGAKFSDPILLQQLKNAKYNPDTKEYKSNNTPELEEGTQGGFKFFNRTKAGLSDSPHFSQKKLYSAHFKSIYGHTERYALRAGRMFGRKVYSMMQDGEGNALRTFEQGRYYISTGIAFTNAVVHARVINSDKATTLADRSKLALEDKIKTDVKLQKYQATNDLRAKIYKELEDEKFIGVTRKQIGNKVEQLKMAHQVKVEKKFGKLAKLSDSELTKEIESLMSTGAAVKSRIKELKRLGDTISPEQRKTLNDLKKVHAANSQKLRKLFGLKKERESMDLKLGILHEGAEKLGKNMRAFTSGIYALRGFISKPFREGDAYAAGGLYNAATFVANRHTRMVIRKSIKASVWVGGKAIDTAYLLTGNNPMMWHTAADTIKLNAKVKVDVVKKTIKTAQVDARRKTIKTAREGAKFVGNKIADYTPARIRTAAKGGWNGLVSTKRKIDIITGSIRERYQRSLVNKGISAARTWVDRTVKSIKMFFSTATKILTKAILAFGGVFVGLVLIITIMGAFMSASSAGGSILSPYDSEEEDNKINLAPYMQILTAEQSDFDTTLNKTLQTKVYRGKKYDKVSVNYATSLRSNHKEMLSMMAVRFKQDISLEDNLAVRLYLKSLYHDSHTVAAKESEPYSCTGCKTRTKTHNPGCEEHTEYCEGIVELRKCTNKNDEGECEGHKKYTCPGHKETYCPGKHVDLTLTVSVLGFDEIFTADSMANAGANVQAGGLIGNATITYYCAEKYPHICNAGPPYLTATGTTPTPNRTIAVDPKKIPLGTHVVIFGQEYIAEDTGGAVDGMHIDILVKTHAEALAKGTRYNVPVYSVSIEGEGGEDAKEWEGWTQDNIEWAKVIYSPNWSDIYTGVNDYGNGNIEIGNLVVAGDWVWPVTATTSSSGFGWRDDPMNPGNPDFHKGTDIAISEGTPVHAAGDGTVAASNFSSSAGNMIIINHADGVVTKYFHNSQLLVSVGDKVKAGQVIAYSGNTGNSTGPHLHFEFWVNGKVMDPRLQYGL